jgi:hypothetical protein
VTRSDTLKLFLGIAALLATFALTIVAGISH